MPKQLFGIRKRLTEITVALNNLNAELKSLRASMDSLKKGNGTFAVHTGGETFGVAGGVSVGGCGQSGAPLTEGYTVEVAKGNPNGTWRSDD